MISQVRDRRTFDVFAFRGRLRRDEHQRHGPLADLGRGSERDRAALRVVAELAQLVRLHRTQRKITTAVGRDAAPDADDTSRQNEG